MTDEIKVAWWDNNLDYYKVELKETKLADMMECK
jgi:hypothetical protein